MSKFIGIIQTFFFLKFISTDVVTAIRRPSKDDGDIESPASPPSNQKGSFQNVSKCLFQNVSKLFAFKTSFIWLLLRDLFPTKKKKKKELFDWRINVGRFDLMIGLNMSS